MYKGKTNMIENGESEVRPIDANALIRTACEKFYTTNYYSHILEMIDDAPTIEPKKYYDKGYADAVQDIADVMVRQGKHIASDEPKQGEWKVVYDSKDSDLPMRMCSECGQKIPITARLNYCFECGARMKGESDDVYTFRNEDGN